MTPDQEMTAASVTGMAMIGAARLGDIALLAKIGLELGGREAQIVALWLAMGASQALRQLDESAPDFDVDLLMAAWGKMISLRSIDEGRAG